ncbi:tRNA-splicing endonuclease, SEN1 homologue, putative [Theileria annulata]|uniref:tRNA-splicing endonuclease, SEN1 homologue, putative n=1 Tax=Theileria annulata TaxID=5874 RepID=Q4U8X5_THEAN|nr:tRNA-splicing endonuclease, SEN1 homologue, putative [Theileria annulata]CAI76728.1 tRNA-splicing endonuclease, SEN1 homologue, putative [Theileria annulata]|eukprot:XP_953353.1 tRNA-splicing endonuclease, SEN1 homologue, putative [Theileria annulata]
MSKTNPKFSTLDDILVRLLSFDFYRDLIQDGNDNLKSIQKRIKWHSTLKPLPSQITNVEDYHNSFFSLFMVECLEILTQSKYNDLTLPVVIEPISCNISGVFGSVTFTLSQPLLDFSSGDLVLLHISKPNHVNLKRDINNKFVNHTAESSKSLSSDMDTTHPIYEDNLKHCLGYVISIMKNRILVKILLLPPKFATPETFDDRDLDRIKSIQTQLSSILSTHSQMNNATGKSTTEEWHISRLLSLTTIMREFKGLCMLEHMPLKDYLLTKVPENNNSQDPDTCKELVLDFEIPKKLKKTIEANYNSGQLSALSNSLKNTGISLIQGPPGTGKTTTIMSIISVILYSTIPTKKKKNVRESQKKHLNKSNFRKKNFWFFDEENGVEDKMTFDELQSDENYDYCSITEHNIYDCFNTKTKNNENKIYIGSEKQSNKRILICAPSNAAIDEIVKRLVSPDGGIFDANGNRYNPTVTRVGPNFNEDLREFSLQTKINNWDSKNNLSSLRGDRSNTINKPTIIMDILLNSEVVCSTLSGCGSKELYGLINCFDTLIVDEATQAVELSTLIPFNLGCKRAILVGDPCQLSATVCSKVAIQLNYDQSLFKRLQLCGYPVNFLKLQYRMDPLITRFPSMYFYQNQLVNAKETSSVPEEDWRQFPLLRPTVFFALDSQESMSDTSYVNEMEVDLVCQLLDIIVEIFSAIPGITEEEICKKIAVISPYAAQAEILKNTISQRIKILPTFSSVYKALTGSKTHQIYVSTVDGFQGMEKEIIIFSAVRTNYVGNRKARNSRIEDLTSPSILTINSEPHDPRESAKFSKLTDEYLKNISENTPDLTTNVIDASFIADRRRINVAITRACSNLFIVGNPRYLLDHKHWSALYNHYAKTGSIFICKTQNNSLDPKFLRNWSREYLNRSPEQYRKLLKNKYLKDFVTKLVS